MRDVVIRRMTEADVRLVARLHASELAASFLGRLGAGFLEKLHRFMNADASFACWVAERDGNVVGYVGGTLDTDGFYGRIYKRYFVPLALSVARRALFHPSIAWQALTVL